MINGIVLLDKPKGPTSFDLVAQLRRQFPKKTKVGHAGTLDPMASGLLVCLVGKATRLMPYLANGRKRYEGTIQLGIKTDSDDLEGEVLERNSIDGLIVDLKKLESQFTGVLQQMPPIFSAKRVDGKRSYQLAREGKAPELKPCEITVFGLSLRQSSSDSLEFSVECSKGTYIRSLARDIGTELGVGASLARLRRTESFPFSLADAVEPTEFSPDNILPWWRGFPKKPTVKLSESSAHSLTQGAIARVSRELSEFLEQSELGRDGLFLYESKERPGIPLGILRAEGEQSEIAINFCDGV